jgi:excisionase family DNA binding protein
MSAGALPESDKLLVPAEVATMFRVDPKTVTRWAKAGKLTSIRTLGGHRRYRETEVRALIAGSAGDASTEPLRAPLRTLWPSGIKGPAATLRNRLLASGLSMVGDLTAKTADDLKHLGLRPPQIDEVRLVLHRKGLALYGEVADEAA